VEWQVSGTQFEELCDWSGSVSNCRESDSEGGELTFKLSGMEAAAR
jgi:hypothetical protein